MAWDIWSHARTTDPQCVAGYPKPSWMASLLTLRQGVRLGVTPRGFFGVAYISCIWIPWNTNLQDPSKNLINFKGGVEFLHYMYSIWRWSIREKLLRGNQAPNFGCAWQAHRQPCQHGLQESKRERKWARPWCFSIHHAFSCLEFCDHSQVSGKCNSVISILSVVSWFCSCLCCYAWRRDTKGETKGVHLVVGCWVNIWAFQKGWELSDEHG